MCQKFDSTGCQMEVAQPGHGKHSSTACVHAWWATTQKHSTKHNGNNMQAMCAHHVSQGSGDRNIRATLVATRTRLTLHTMAFKHSMDCNNTRVAT